MVTINEYQYIGNDNNKIVAAENPRGKGVTYDYLITTAATTKPGMPGSNIGAGAGAETGFTASAAANYSGITHIAEFDPLQIADCSVAYANGDLIPAIRLNANKGLICRNCMVVDPVSQVIDANDPLTAVLTGFDANVTQDGTTGVYAKNLYRLADSSADVRAVIEIVGDGW